MNPTTIDSKLEHNQIFNQLKQLHNLEKITSHEFSFQPHVKQVEATTIYVVFQQTQPLNQNVWSSVFVMGIVERPPIQQSVPVLHPTIEIASTCAYCQ